MGKPRDLRMDPQPGDVLRCEMGRADAGPRGDRAGGGGMTREQAVEMYRAAWLMHQQTPDVRWELQLRMDELQPKIAPGPGPVWLAFAQTLPGFLEFWATWHKDMTVKVQEFEEERGALH